MTLSDKEKAMIKEAVTADIPETVKIYKMGNATVVDQQFVDDFFRLKRRLYKANQNLNRANRKIELMELQLSQIKKIVAETLDVLMAKDEVADDEQA